MTVTGSAHYPADQAQRGAAIDYLHAQARRLRGQRHLGIEHYAHALEDALKLLAMARELNDAGRVRT